MSSIGLDAPPEQNAQCRAPGLVLEQSRICEANTETMPFVGRGVTQGLAECKHQFAFERWNCTGSGLSLNGPVLNAGEAFTSLNQLGIVK